MLAIEFHFFEKNEGTFMAPKIGVPGVVTIGKREYMVC